MTEIMFLIRRKQILIIYAFAFGRCLTNVFAIFNFAMLGILYHKTFVSFILKN